MLNDADIAKHWPSVHTKIHLHKQQAFDHVNTMNSGHYADSATYFAYLTYAAVLWNIIRHLVRHLLRQVGLSPAADRPEGIFIGLL